MRLVISVVTYQSDRHLFTGTLRSICDALDYAKCELPNLSCDLYIIENDFRKRANQIQAEEFFLTLRERIFNAVIIKTMASNLGYGKGHNFALGEETAADFYLILNPDVRLAKNAILCGLRYMQSNPSMALVSPSAVDGEGVRLHLCKTFPAIFDLLLRGFAPDWLRGQFKSRLRLYEMHELANTQQPTPGVPIVSGCCMLLEGSKLRLLGGFDEKYFLYFEDFDLSLRASEVGCVTYLPEMKIVHYGGGASRKGFMHIAHFLRSALRFYNQYGWRWFK